MLFRSGLDEVLVLPFDNGVSEVVSIAAFTQSAHQIIFLFVDVRTVGFAVSFRSCRAIQGGFLLLAMLCSYLVNDTWSLPSLSRSTGMGS